MNRDNEVDRDKDVIVINRLAENRIVFHPYKKQLRYLETIPRSRGSLSDIMREALQLWIERESAPADHDWIGEQLGDTDIADLIARAKPQE